MTHASPTAAPASVSAPPTVPASGTGSSATSLPSHRHYVVSVPTGFVAASGKFRQAIEHVDAAGGVQVLASTRPAGDKLVVLTDDEARAFRARFPSLTLEPNILYRKARHPVLADFHPLFMLASAATRSATIRVTGSAGRPVPNVTVYAVVDAAANTGVQGVTDANGYVTFQVPTTVAAFASVIALPAAGYWSRRARQVPVQVAPYTLDLTPLPSPAAERYDWGHREAGMVDGAAGGGAGVRVGVIDTGIRNDHPDLRPNVDGRNCVFGEPPGDWNKDEDGHGTHCAGVIAALLNGQGLKGYVPAVELRAYRVFATGATGATTFDIATALERAIEDGCDIISMSLGAPTPQTAIRSKIELAYDRGVMCIAATGNEGGAVSYPAGFPNVFGVGALGKFGMYPTDSLHAEAESAVVDPSGAWYVANFSNRGEQQVDFAAPGVAVCSTVPGGGYAAWDGTSMACPHVAGLAALALAARPAIRDAARTSERVDALETVLRAAARPLGVGSMYEGSGRLTVGPLWP